MSESKIQAITFAFAALLLITGIALIWGGRLDFLSVLVIFVPAFLLTLVAALGPSRLREIFAGTKQSSRDETSKRHFCSEPERNICLVITDDFPPPKLTKETRDYLEAAGKRSDDTRCPEDYLMLGSHAWRMKDSEKALEYIFSGLALEVADNRVRAAMAHRLGTILQTMRADEIAIKKYNEAIKLNPQFSWPHNSLGLTYRYQKNFEAADKEFEEAIRLYPGNTRPRYNLGVSYMSQKRIAEAEKIFREILKMDPQNYRAHNRLGLIFLEEGKIDKAEEQFRESLKIEPGYVKAQKNLMPLLQEKERKAEETRKRDEERRKREEGLKKKEEEKNKGKK